MKNTNSRAYFHGHGGARASVRRGACRPSSRSRCTPAIEPCRDSFWATHNGAELDLLLMTGGRRVGVEVKRVDAPRRTRSMAVALDDLRLDGLWVVYPGDARYAIDERITALPAGAPFPGSDAFAPAAYPAPPAAGGAG